MVENRLRNPRNPFTRVDEINVFRGNFVKVPERQLSLTRFKREAISCLLDKETSGIITYI